MDDELFILPPCSNPVSVFEKGSSKVSENGPSLQAPHISARAPLAIPKQPLCFPVSEPFLLL